MKKTIINNIKVSIAYNLIENIKNPINTFSIGILREIFELLFNVFNRKYINHQLIYKIKVSKQYNFRGATYKSIHTDTR